MLLLTSFIGSVIGFLVCYKTIASMSHLKSTVQMRICMINSMSLAFIFAMLIELTTDSKSFAIIVPVVTVCLPMVFMMKTFTVLDVIESCTVTLMSTSMSIMLIGMVDPGVIWVIQVFLVAIEGMLYAAIQRRVKLG